MLKRCKHCKIIFKTKQKYKEVCDNCKKDDTIKEKHRLNISTTKRKNIKFKDNIQKLKYE